MICEKPLVLNPWNVDALIELEKEYPNKVNTILQLRHHKSILALKDKIEKGDSEKVYEIDLTYITSRGKWYFTSWKGNESKSGGISSNMGKSIFDMLQWIFGSIKDFSVHIKTPDTNAGTLKFKQGNVNWYLSINSEKLPPSAKENGLPTFRSLKIAGEEIEFSKGFTELHTVSYQKILEGKGYGLIDAKKSIEIVSKIRNKEL